MKLFNRSTKAGFTLVELIVVIAILGILAGIAIPVYSGYIKKANQAADNTLLGAVNTAFAAASVDGGYYNGRPASAQAILTDEGAVSSVISPADSDGSLFAKYFSGNEGSTFKVYSKLSYNSADGMFYGLASSGDAVDLGEGWTVTSYSGPNGTVLSYTNGEMTLDVSESDKTAVINSTFGDEDTITMSDMMNEINGVVMLAAGMIGGEGGAASALTAITEDAGFKSFVSALGANDEDLEDNTKLLNALVLYAATNTGSVDSSAMLSALKSAGSDPAGVLAAAAAGGEDTASMLSSAAMIYGLATSYAYSNNIDTSDGAINTLVSVIKSEDWSAYLESEQAAKDITGYSGAMGIISDNVSNLDTDSLLSGGFVSNDLIDMLNIIFEQGNN